MQDSAQFFFVFAMGIAVGSFLNVCIHRLPRRESVITLASHCSTCARPLLWFENVPLFSYMLLRGFCRTCHARISIVYPLVEMTTGLLFVAHYWQLGWRLLTVSRLIFISVMVVLCVIDLKHRILPDAITLPGIVFGFFFSWFMEPGWQSSLTGIVFCGGAMFVIREIYYWIRNEEGIGMGDIKMLGMIGAFLGWKLTLLTLMLSVFLGSVVGVLVVVAGRGDMKHALPFGPLLSVFAVLAVLSGESIISWYLSLY
jgi:leader peptidase (prepilin peptidase)/N-methyltransferase